MGRLWCDKHGETERKLLYVDDAVLLDKAEEELKDWSTGLMMYVEEC